MGTVFLVIVFFVIGILAYRFDKNKPGMYAWWYDIWHKEPLEEGADIGFIHNQGIKQRIAAAILIAFIKSFVFSMLSIQPRLTEVGLMFLEVPVLLIAFYSFNPIMSLWSKKDDAIDAVKDAKDYVEDKIDDAKETFEEIKSKTPFPGATPESKTPTPSKEEQKAKEKSAREKLKDSGLL